MASALPTERRVASPTEVTAAVEVRVAGSTLWINPALRWVKVVQYMRTALNRRDAQFVYTTDDSSYKMISADSDWKRALSAAWSLGGSDNDRELIVNLKLASELSDDTTEPKCCPDSEPTSQCCSAGSGCGGKKADEPKICCHPIAEKFSQPKDARRSPENLTSDLPVLSGKECYKCDAMFNTTSPVGSTPPPKVVNPTLSEYRYSGEALRACQLPLGPIGGGVIAIAGDGGLRQWQVLNEVNHNGHVPDSFWGIKTELAGRSQCKVLQSAALYDDKHFVPPYEITDHVVPPASVRLLQTLPGIPEVEITAKYPVVEVDYPNTDLPVDIHMTAWNPCIPLDQNSSGLPIIIFNFEVTNRMTEDVQVTLLNSQQNMVGWDGETPIINGVYNSSYGGNSNALVQLNDNLTAIDMFNTGLSDPDGGHYDSHDGHFASCVVTGDNDVVSSLLQFDTVESMWTMFASDKGLSDNGLYGPSPVGRTWDAALALTRVVPAQATTTFTFYLAWHFPHRIANWSQPAYKHTQPEYIGNYYSTLYPDITSVLQHTQDNYDDLQKYTMAFRDCMFNSTLPWQLIDSAAGRVSPLRSPTCMWLADGRLYAFEGCRQTAGCCPLNCTHVWNYEQSLANLWPALEQTMRDIDLGAGCQVTPLGRLVSRTNVPQMLRPTWMFWENYNVSLASTTACVDGELGAVLKLYREMRMGATDSFFATMWPNAKRIMDRWMTVNDQGDGTMKIAQPNTYDCALYGENTFIGTLYLCALRAAEEMALIAEDEVLAKQYNDRFTMGRDSLDKKCFVNDQWYTQLVDPENQIQILSDATFVDSLLGQWWGYILQLGDILPADHCQSNVVNIFARNHRAAFEPKEQSPRPFYDQRDAGMVIASWPSGDPPKNRLRYTTECAWTGLSHYFAGLCIYLDQVDIGLQVLEDARYCYDGTRRSPWNEIECGDHYSRPMCAFQLFAAASGITWSAVDSSGGRIVGFKPRIGANNFQGFFNLPNAWGQYVQTASEDFMSGTAEITLAYGSLSISQLWVPFQNDDLEQISVTLANGSTAIPVNTTEMNEGYLKLIFSGPVSFDTSSQPLQVKITSLNY